MTDFTDLQLLILEKSTIECGDIEALFGDFVEDDLPATLRARVDRHIKGCADCRQFQKEYCDVIQLARELGEEVTPAPVGVQNRLREALNARLGLSLAPVGE